MATNTKGESKNFEPSKKDYIELTDIEHMRKLPDGYIGSKEQISEEEWLLTFSEPTEENPETVVTGVCQNMIDLPRGLERLYLEILSNAADNAGRSLAKKVKPGVIEITMTDDIITVKNGGLSIPIEKNEKGIFIPEMIFGRLRTSSNYSGDRHEVGINGIGAKAANIFSKYFSVTIENSNNKLRYYQEWNENMSVKSEPHISSYSGRTSSTEISYVADFEYFGYPDLKYPSEAFYLFARHAADVSFTCRTPTIFNGIYMNYSNIVEYSRLYFGDSVNNCVIHYQWPNDVNPKSIVKHKTDYGVTYQECKDPMIKPVIELIAIDTPDDSKYISFVNCMMTRKGGAHLKAAIDGCFQPFLKSINESILGKLKTKNKDEEKKDKTNFGISMRDISPHISMILNCWLVNPKFTDHSKVELSKPKPKIVLTEAELKPLNKWKLGERLHAEAEAKQFANISKEEKQMGHKKDPKHIAANFAKLNNPRHLECTLFIMEGDSAAAYSESYLKNKPNGRDTIGTFPIRGKGMNVMNKSLIKVAKNEEIKRLKSALNLEDGLDYEIEENFQTLKYGKIMIMADADVDGKHIIGLILNYFFVRFPSLLMRGYIKHYRTRIVNVSFKNESIKFYTKAKYEEWRDQTPNYKLWEHKYYKGLASSKDETIREDYLYPKEVEIEFDDDTNESMILAFHKNMADMRKEWISNWKPTLELEDLKVETVSQFINYELAEFSLANLQRSIPRLEDGLKESQRKILAGGMSKWNYNEHANKYPSFKVAQFGGYIADKMQYEHGEKSLEEAIVGMVQDYIGSNNVPLFYPDGQFGTRAKGGKDAGSSRYIFTYPMRISTYMFRSEDKSLLIHKESEGEMVEPIVFYPVVPVALINGVAGIGSGHSTFIPPYNPKDILTYIRNRIRQQRGETGVKLPALKPWYRGHKGDLKVSITRGTKAVMNVKEDLKIPEESSGSNSSESSETSEELPGQVKEGEKMPKVTMISYGNFHIDEKNIIIDELPVGKWTNDYLVTLELMKENKIIKDYRNLSAKNRVYFELSGFSGKPDHEKLYLRKTFGLTNMVLLDENNKPKKYQNADEIIEEYFIIRLEKYRERKEILLNDMKEKIKYFEELMAFIRAVLQDKIKYKNVPKDDIIDQLIKLELNVELLSVVKFYDCTKEKIEELQNKIDNTLEKYRIMEDTPASDFWLEDLDEFEREYENLLDQYERAEAGDYSNVGTGKKRRKKNVAVDENADKVGNPKVRATRGKATGRGGKATRGKK